MSRMPQVTARELSRFLRAQGFAEDRRSGSHLTLWHEGRKVSVTIPVHTGCDIGRGLAVRILKDAGFTVERQGDEAERCSKPVARSFVSQRLRLLSQVCAESVPETFRVLVDYHRRMLSFGGKDFSFCPRLA